MSTERPFPPWGDREIKRFTFRVGLFRRRGVPEGYAEELADRLYERDYERDDRRLCIECAHMQRGDTCFAAQQGRKPRGTPPDPQAKPHPMADSDPQMRVLRYVLQRCPCFDFVKPA